MACDPARAARLLAEGWVRQFMAEEPRLSEAAAQYRQLGCEVRLEPVDAAGCAAGGGCSACYQDPAAAARYKVIFTRRRPRPAAAGA